MESLWSTSQTPQVRSWVAIDDVNAPVPFTSSVSMTRISRTSDRVRVPICVRNRIREILSLESDYGLKSLTVSSARVSLHP